MIELAAKKTSLTADDLRSALRVAWVNRFGSEPPTNAIEVLMSQSALETGAWKYCVAYNIANVKSNGTAGDFCFFTTTERLDEKVAREAAAKSTTMTPAHLLTTTPDHEGKLKVIFEPRNPVCRFRAFESLAQGAAFYLSFLTNHYAAAWAFVLSGDIFGFNHQLKVHGFYTAEEHLYLSALCRAFDEYGTPKLSGTVAIVNALCELGYEETPIAEAVKAFQRDNDLDDDGDPGPLTRAKIRWALSVTPPRTPTAA